MIVWLDTVWLVFMMKVLPRTGICVTLASLFVCDFLNLLNPFFLKTYLGSDSLISLSIPERGTLLVAQKGLLGARKDFGKTLLLESILQTPTAHEDEVVKVELPHNEVFLIPIIKTFN